MTPHVPEEPNSPQYGGGGEEELLNALGEAHPGLQARFDLGGVVLGGAVHPSWEVGIQPLKSGVKVFEQLPEPLAHALRKLLGRAAETRTLQKTEVELASGGKTSWCSVSLVPRETSYYLFAFDITDRKRGDVKRHDLEQRLRHVHRMEALGQLAGGLAHDFNNLLTVITGHAQILRSRFADGSDALVNLDKIQSASDGAASLTRVLLDFSRTSLVHPEWINLNQVLEHLERPLDRILRDDVVFELDRRVDLPDVWADRGSVEQMFIGLADNGAASMPTGGRFLVTTSTVTLTQADRQDGETFVPGDYVLVTFRDTGDGFSPDADGMVADISFSKKTVGRGLGLDSLYGTMELVNGLVRMRTMKGVGTVFSLYFPTFRAPVLAPTERPARPQGAGLQGTETLLVCDDNDSVRGVMRETLVAAGYQVIATGTPTEALVLEDAHEEVLHMLVTDLVMPQMTGAELAQAMRERRPGLRVLFVTGYPEEVVQHQTPLDEDDALLPKPFTPPDLLERVRELLDRREENPRH